MRAASPPRRLASRVLIRAFSLSLSAAPFVVLGGNNFATPQATALSLATISGGSIANLWTYTQRYHPNKKILRPLIDYDASLLFCPALLAGTMFGSMFSVMFPEWLVVVCLVLLLGYSAYRTLKKGKQKWEASQTAPDKPAENGSSIELVNTSSKRGLLCRSLDEPPSDAPDAAASDSSTDSAEGAAEGASLTPHERADTEEGKRSPSEAIVDANVVSSDAVKPALERVQSMHEDPSVDPQLRAMYLEETALSPVSFKGGFKVHSELLAKLSFTALLWMIVLVFALLRGGRGGESIVNTMSGSSAVECGSASYWILFFVNIAILVACTVHLRKKLLNRYELKISLGHVPLEGDLQWTKRSTAVYPAFCVFAGVGAGLLGIGGGMVLGPLLVALGCLPQPVAATSAYVVFITATSGLCQVIIFGLLPYDYAALSAAVGLASTFFGQSVVDYIVKKYKKDAIVILVIGAIMAIALVLMTYAGIMKVANGAPIGFSPLC